MDSSRKSSESESSDSTTGHSSCDEEQLPVKKPFQSYYDPDETASSVCPPLNVASTEGTTVLRRSLRKIIEESKKDAASSSVSNSRESTPPRMSGLGRQISSPQAFSPASSSWSARLSKNSGSIVSAEKTKVARYPDFQQRSTSIRRVKHVGGNVTKSLPVGTAVSSDDDSSSLKESNKVCSSLFDLNAMTKSSLLPSLADTSDTDSRASSLCAYSTQSTASGQISAVKSNSHSSTPAKQKTGKRSRRFTRGRDKLLKMQSSDSETDSRTNALRTSFFDSFPDNSSNGSSIASSIRNAELSTDGYVDNCKYDVSGCSEAKETQILRLGLDEADLKESAEFDTNAEKHHQSELKARSPPSSAKETVLRDMQDVKSCLKNKDLCFQKKIGETSESNNCASDSLMQKGKLLGETRSAASATEDSVIDTKEEKDALLNINCNNLEAAGEDMKIKESVQTVEESRVADQNKDEEAKADVHSKPTSDDGSKEQDVNGKFEEETDEMLNVKEEPPEILVNLLRLL